MINFAYRINTFSNKFAFFSFAGHLPPPPPLTAEFVPFSPQLCRLHSVSSELRHISPSPHPALL